MIEKLNLAVIFLVKRFDLRINLSKQRKIISLKISFFAFLSIIISSQASSKIEAFE